MLPMTILVFDVPAVSGGALTILREWYKQAVESSDESMKWIFIVSRPELRETDNVKILRFPWVKRSWFHRLYFDYFIAPKLVEKYDADEILSLQNVIVPKTGVPQTLYVHQSLPFIDQRFKLTEAPRFWVYQNIIGKMIFKSIQKASKIIVQTNWMKHACVHKAGIRPEKVVINPPLINVEIKSYFEPTENSFKTFFYPASGVNYKNHELVVDAAMLLKERGVSEYRVVFTLRGNENKHISGLYRKVNDQGLPIEFAGTITREQVFDYYTQSVLIFPSYIETFGLPLLEARLHGTPILASDRPFSREILDGYERAFFFGVNDAMTLANLMKKSLSLKLVIGDKPMEQAKS